MTLSHGPWMTQVVRCVVAVAVTVARESKLLRSCARQLKARQGVRSFVRSFTSVCVCVWVWGVEYGVLNSSSRPGARGGNESTTDNHQQQAASQCMPAWQCREMGWMGGRFIHFIVAHTHSHSHSLSITHALTRSLTHSLRFGRRFGDLEIWRFGRFGGLEVLWRVWTLRFGDFEILGFWDFGILEILKSLEILRFFIFHFIF